MTSKEAPPETAIQRAVREHWTVAMGATKIGWGRDRHGRFLAPFAQRAEDAWVAAIKYAEDGET